MPRLHRFFGLVTEMPRKRGDATWAVLDWAARQKGEFTIRQLYDVYVANGGREGTVGDNIQSFSTHINHYIAKPWKEDQKKYGLSDKRPIVYAKRGRAGGGGGSAHLLKWGLDHPLRDPGHATFVNPEDDNNTGGAMDRLEKALSRMGKGLPADEKAGRQKAKAAIDRWRKMGNLNKVVADIRATIPKIAQMDALHIASEFLVDSGKADEDDVEDAEDEVAPAPTKQQSFNSDDEDEDYGEFSDEPASEPEEYPEDDVYDEPEEEPAPAPKATTKPTATPSHHFKVGDTVKRNWAGVTPAEKARIKPHIMNATGTVTKLENTPEGPAARVKWDYEDESDKPYPFLVSELEPADDEEPDVDELDPDDVEFDEPDDDTKKQAGAANFLKPQAPAAPAASPAAKKPSSVAKFFKR